MSAVHMVIGGLAFLMLTFLPGTWLTFGLRVPGMPFWSRFWVGAALAPLVVIVPFYLLIGIGVPFRWTTMAIVVLSLSGLVPMVRRRMPIPLPSRRDVIVIGLVTLPVAILLAVNYFPLQFAAFTGHAWLHTDVVYQLANGNLRPEEPDLAGIRLSYPWLAYVHHAMQSWVLGSAPTANYGWINAGRLLVTVGIVWMIAARLGGGIHAKLWTAVLLLFGVNFVGYLLPAVLPERVVEDYPIWGDWRYTPWIRKFYFFNSMDTALAMFAAMVLLAVEDVVGDRSADRQLLAALLAVAIGITYPLLFPAALAATGGVAIVHLIGLRLDGRAALGKLTGPALVAAVSTVATVLALAWTTADRGPAPTLGASELYAIKLKTAESVVVLAPLLLGTLGAVWLRRREDVIGLAVPIIAAIGSVMLHATFNILHYRNEYKYITTAAMALAPLAGIAAGTIVTRAGRLAPTLTVLAALILIAPGFHRRYRWDGTPLREPRLDARDFDLRLADGERLAGALDAIRRKTPTDAVVVAGDHGLHLPTLVRRAQYVPFADVTYPGINVTADGLLADVRGYPRSLIDARRLALHRLLAAGSSDAEREAALGEILALGRPVAMLLDESSAAGTVRWLAVTLRATPIYRGPGVSVWLVATGVGSN